MIYPQLDKDSKCINCVGCEKLAISHFRGVKICDNFIECYSDEEKAEKLRRENEENQGNYYGSMYGNND